MPLHEGTERVERNAGDDLRDALQRLVDNVPSRVPEVRRRQKNGTLRINLSTVAMEARRSRTLIGTGKEDCAYKDVREEVREAARRLKQVKKATTGRHLTAKETIEKLHDQVRRLGRENAIVATKLAAAVNVARDLERRLDRSEEDLIDARRVARGRPPRKKPDVPPEPPAAPPKPSRPAAKPEGTVLPFTRDR